MKSPLTRFLNHQQNTPIFPSLLEMCGRKIVTLRLDYKNFNLPATLHGKYYVYSL